MTASDTPLYSFTTPLLSTSPPLFLHSSPPPPHYSSTPPGVTHNIPLLREIITHPLFVAGDISTNFLPEVYPEGFKGHQLEVEERREVLASAAAVYVSAQLRSHSLLGNLR